MKEETKNEIKQTAGDIAEKIRCLDSDYRGFLLYEISVSLHNTGQNYTASLLRRAASEYRKHINPRNSHITPPYTRRIR